MFQNEQRITITARDLKVVSALQCDGRMTMQALADKIGISVYAATESYRRLTESGIMSIVPVCNPLSLGNYSQVLVGLRLDGSRMRLLPCSNPCHRSPTWSALWGMPTSSLRLWCIRLKAWIISSNMVCARCRDCPVCRCSHADAGA